MDLWSIVKTIGTGVISATAGPAAPLILGAINAALPDDAKLPENATGQQAQDAISALPAAERVKVMDKQLDVDITQIKESHDTVRTMLTTDATNPQSTRPYIAKQAFHVIAFSVVITTSFWAYAVAIENNKMVTAIMDGWPFMVSVNATLAALLRAYFGLLNVEQKNKLDAANGQSQPTGLAGLVSAFMKK